MQNIDNYSSFVGWSDNLFAVNQAGDIVVNGFPTEVTLASIVNAAKQEGFSTPITLQFPEILRTKLNSLVTSFDTVKGSMNYNAKYIPVYPIKVNQKKEVLQTFANMDVEDFGLESGSKAEFILSMSYAKKGKTILICNGNKDYEYIMTALIAHKIGHIVYLIIDKFQEIELILKAAAELQVKPILGVRARLSTVDDGKGQNYTGERSKFGLSTEQILELMQVLTKHELLDNLQILHFHMGTQLSNIKGIQHGLLEGAQLFKSLVALGANIHSVNVGGGLAVDYEGTKSRSMHSKNYDMQGYAQHIIYAFHKICQEYNLAHPNIITESGRALTAHHAVFIFDILSIESYLPRKIQNYDGNNKHMVIRELLGLLDNDKLSLIEIYHDTTYWLEQVSQLFANGVITLTEKAMAESIGLDLFAKVRDKLIKNKSNQEIIEYLELMLSNKIFGNFSIFRSTPDVWAIDQVLPILPISGLASKDTARYIIADITCDSDGTFNYYVDHSSIEKSVTLPQQLGKGDCMAIFLVGAYQDILGDNHNLFSKTNSVSVIPSNDGFSLVDCYPGDSVAKVISDLNHEEHSILDKLLQQVNSAKLTTTQQQEYLDYLQAAYTGYTYMED